MREGIERRKIRWMRTDEEWRSAGAERTRERIDHGLHHERLVLPDRARAAEEHDVRRIRTPHPSAHLGTSHARTKREERVEMRGPGDPNGVWGNVVNVDGLLRRRFVPRQEHIWHHVDRTVARE